MVRNNKYPPSLSFFSLGFRLFAAICILTDTEGDPYKGSKKVILDLLPL